MTEKPILSCSGRCDGMGDLDPAGSYVRIVYQERHATHHIALSEGAAAQLSNEINGALAQRPPPIAFATGDPLLPRKPCKRHSWMFDNATCEVRCTTPGCEAVR